MSTSSKSFKILVVIITLVAVISVLKSFLVKKDQKEIVRVQNERTINAISKLMLLPPEEPVVATVREAEALRKEQPFYANVSNGDQLLLFPKARQAVIYSPSRNIIVNAGSLTIANNQDQKSSQNSVMEK